jgi:ABC-type multidrug transport system ATPase subunit
MLEAGGVTKEYFRRPVVNRVSFTIRAGEVLGERIDELPRLSGLESDRHAPMSSYSKGMRHGRIADAMRIV